MHDTGALMNAVASRDQRFLVLVHETGPAFQHVHDVKIRTVIMPTRPFLRRAAGSDELRKHFAGGCVRDPEITIDKEVTKSFSFEIGVGRFNVGKLHPCLIQHEPLLRKGSVTLLARPRSVGWFGLARGCYVEESRNPCP